MAGYWVMTIVGRGDPSKEVLFDPNYAVVTQFVHYQGPNADEPTLQQIMPGIWPGIIAELGSMQVVHPSDLDGKLVHGIWRVTQRMRGLFPTLCNTMFMARFQFRDCMLSELNLRTADAWVERGLERAHADILVANDIIGVPLLLGLDTNALLGLPGITHENIGAFRVYQQRLR
jgi:hypothetical protein